MRRKKRESLNEILQSTSDALFPEELGTAVISIDSRDCDGDGPLHVLLRRGNNYGVRALVDAGADINASGDMGLTPLHIALMKKNREAVELLLRSGARADVTSEFGSTARDLASDLGGPFAALFR